MRLLRTVVSTLALTTVVGSLTFATACKQRNADSGLLQNNQGGGGGNNPPPVNPPNPPPGPRPDGNTRIRMSVFDPNNRANVDAYVRGFRALQSTDAGRRTWEALAKIHEDFCPHGNWYFLPWHRVYLHHFERVIAVASGKADFALPYWDWDGNDRNRMPDDTLNANGLFWQRRGANARSNTTRMLPNNVGAPAMQQIMGANNFLSFGSGRARGLRDNSSHGLLESMPHNSTHVWVGGNGGDMASFMSPRDPIFWMHHNNVDRIWSAWMRKQTRSNLPTVPPNGGPLEVRTQVWLDTQLRNGFIEPAAGATEQNPATQAAQRAYAVSQTLDSVRTFGYDYDNFSAGGFNLDENDGEVQVATPSEYNPSYTATLELKLKQVALFETKRAVVFVIDIANSTGKSADGSGISATELMTRAHTAIRSGNEPSMMLYVDGVPVPRNPTNTSLEFYFNPRPQQQPEKSAQDFLGTYSFFGHDHAGHGGSTGLSLTYDLTRILKEHNAPVSAGGNLFVNGFLRYTDDNGNDVTSSTNLPSELKPALKAMKLRVEYSER